MLPKIGRYFTANAKTRTGSDNGQGDGNFRPLREVFVARRGQHTGDGDIHAVGDNAKQRQHGTK